MAGLPVVAAVVEALTSSGRGGAAAPVVAQLQSHSVVGASVSAHIVPPASVAPIVPGFKSDFLDTTARAQTGRGQGEAEVQEEQPQSLAREEHLFFTRCRRTGALPSPCSAYKGVEH